MIPISTEVAWSVTASTYTGYPYRNDTGGAALSGRSTRENGLLNGEAFPPILADSQLELSLIVTGRYGFGFVDVWDYLTQLEVGLFLKGSPTDTQIGTWSAISMSDDELARLFVGPGTPYAIPSEGTAAGRLMPKLRIGGASGLIVETTRSHYTPERSW